MGKLLRTLLIVIVLPFEMIGAAIREIISSCSMIVNVWKGDTFVEAVLKELTYRGGMIEDKKDQARDLAGRFRL